MGLKNAENTKHPYSTVPWSERSEWLWIGCHASAHKSLLLNKTRLQMRSLFIYAWRKAKAWHSDSNEHVGKHQQKQFGSYTTRPHHRYSWPLEYTSVCDAQHCIHNAGLTTTSISHDHDCIHNARLTTISCPWPRLYRQCRTDNYLHHPWPRLRPQCRTDNYLLPMTTKLLAMRTTETALIQSIQGEDNCKVIPNTENLYPYIKAPTEADLLN